MSDKLNKISIKQTGGRPPIYETSADMEKEIISYFDFEKENNNRPTLAGLALHLGFSTVQSIYDNEKRGDEFSYILKRARLAIQHTLCQGSVAMDIFLLKASHGLKETTVSEVVDKTPGYKDLTDEELEDKLKELGVDPSKI